MLPDFSQNLVETCLAQKAGFSEACLAQDYATATRLIAFSGFAAVSATIGVTIWIGVVVRHRLAELEEV